MILTNNSKKCCLDWSKAKAQRLIQGFGQIWITKFNLNQYWIWSEIFIFMCHTARSAEAHLLLDCEVSVCHTIQALWLVETAENVSEGMSNLWGAYADSKSV